jgi:hypothetical protein
VKERKRMSTVRKLNARRGKRGKQFEHTPANMTNPFDVYSEVLYKLQHIIHTLSNHHQKPLRHLTDKASRYKSHSIF